MAFCSAGLPYRSAIRTKLTGMVREPVRDNVDTLYWIISYFDLFAGTAVIWLLKTLFEIGLKLGGYWTGLPFFFGAGVWVCVFLTVGGVKIQVTTKCDKRMLENGISDGSTLA